MSPKPSPRGPGPGAYHADDVRVDRLNEDPPGAPHTLHQLIECCPLHLLPLQVSHTVQKVKHHPALGQLPAQELVQLRGWHIWGEGRGLSLCPSYQSSGHRRTLRVHTAASPALRPPALCHPSFFAGRMSHPPFLQGKGAAALPPNPGSDSRTA